MTALDFLTDYFPHHDFFVVNIISIRLVEGFQKYGAKASKVAVGECHTVILTTDGETLGCGVGEFGWDVYNTSTYVSDTILPFCFKSISFARIWKAEKVYLSTKNWEESESN